MSSAPDGSWFVQTATVRGQFGLDRKIAVKSFRPASSDGPVLRATFFEDLRSAARLRHPYAAELLDFGERDRMLYVVTDWIDGRSLASRCSASAAFDPIPLHLALRIASQTCATPMLAPRRATEKPARAAKASMRSMCQPAHRVSRWRVWVKSCRQSTLHFPIAARRAWSRVSSSSPRPPSSLLQSS